MHAENGKSWEIIVAAFMFCPVGSDYKIKMNTEYLKSQKTLSCLEERWQHWKGTNTKQEKTQTQKICLKKKKSM